MRQLQVNERVRLIHGIPNDYLTAGAEGVIQSIWGQPTPEYEVEFHAPESSEPIRVVLDPDQIEPAGVPNEMPPDLRQAP